MSYKGYVRAWVKVDGKKVYFGDPSPAVHAYTNGGSRKITNPKKVTLEKHPSHMFRADAKAQVSFDYDSGRMRTSVGLSFNPLRFFSFLPQRASLLTFPH